MFYSEDGEEKSEKKHSIFHGWCGHSNTKKCAAPTEPMKKNKKKQKMCTKKAGKSYRRLSRVVRKVNAYKIYLILRPHSLGTVKKLLTEAACPVSLYLLKNRLG